MGTYWNSSVRVQVDHEALRFAFRGEGEGDWTWLPELFDASLLSDEATLPGLPNFTGTFVGMACQDMAGTGRPADFRYFHYVEASGAPDGELAEPALAHREGVA